MSWTEDQHGRPTLWRRIGDELIVRALEQLEGERLPSHRAKLRDAITRSRFIRFQPTPLEAGAKLEGHYRPIAVRRRLIAKMDGHSSPYHRQETTRPIETRILCRGRLALDATSLMAGVEVLSD